MSNALLELLRGMSNSAAANVSAPVDAIAWLLKNAGVNTGTPVGGSDWMRSKGLTSDTTTGAGYVGEAVGGVLPLLAAAKAPQIASMANKAIANAKAPSELGAQAGAIDVEALRKSFPEIDFFISQSGDKAMLDKVVVPASQRGNGRGTSFMESLVSAADADGARVGLTPSTDFGGSKARLIDFYRRFGFVPNKGRNKDFELMASMVRQPKTE